MTNGTRYAQFARGYRQGLKTTRWNYRDSASVHKIENLYWDHGPPNGPIMGIITEAAYRWVDQNPNRSAELTPYQRGLMAGHAIGSMKQTMREHISNKRISSQEIVALHLAGNLKTSKVARKLISQLKE